MSELPRDFKAENVSINMTLPNVERLAKVVLYGLIGLGIVGVLNFLLGPTSLGRDDTDSARERSGLGLHTDYGTGCQYLSAKGGGLTPRMFAGQHMGCRQ